MGYSELELGGLPAGDRRRGRIEEIHKAAERAASLTRQLLAFSRKQLLEVRLLDLNALLADMERMLRRLIGEDIKLVTRTAPSLRPIKADPGQIEQIVMNLVVNARDAMPVGGILTIDTAGVELNAETAHTHGVAPHGHYVMMTVSDTGVGMTPEVQARIFEPFFTTKEAGRGTGLGLSTVYGIVKQSGGYMTVDSEPGRGTSFRIHLPQVEEDAAVEEALRPQTAASPLGTETIMVVEDEVTIREMLRETLEGFGYTVLEAAEVEQATLHCQRHPGPIHLLMTDVVLPGKAGPAVARRLATLCPDMKVLFMSGYTDDAIVRHGVLNGDVAFLQKPFTLVGMARKVREVLDAPATGPEHRQASPTSVFRSGR